MKQIKFDTWKAEYKPRIYEDSGAECFDHDECDCEFLYTFDLTERDGYSDEEVIKAFCESRIWTWFPDGTIRSGCWNYKADVLITERAYHGPMEVIS